MPELTAVQQGDKVGPTGLASLTECCASRRASRGFLLPTG